MKFQVESGEIVPSISEFKSEMQGCPGNTYQQSEIFVGPDSIPAHPYKAFLFNRRWKTSFNIRSSNISPLMGVDIDDKTEALSAKAAQEFRNEKAPQNRGKLQPWKSEGTMTLLPHIFPHILPQILRGRRNTEAPSPHNYHDFHRSTGQHADCEAARPVSRRPFDTTSSFSRPAATTGSVDSPIIGHASNLEDPARLGASAPTRWPAAASVASHAHAAASADQSAAHPLALRGARRRATLVATESPSPAAAAARAGFGLRAGTRG